MKFSLKNVILRRFAEFFFTEVILSVIITALNVAKLLTTQLELFVALFLGVSAFIAINIFQMRHCYFDLKNNLQYYSSNFSAYLLFAFLQITAYIFADAYVYTWLFAITKCVRYLFWGIHPLISVMVFHILGMTSVAIAPIGMKWVFTLEDSSEEEDEEY